MTNARITNHVVATARNRVGLLAEMASTVREAGVNIGAICALEEGSLGRIMMYTDDNDSAIEALATLGDVHAHKESVIAVTLTDEPGALETEAKKISDAGINISCVYGGAGAGQATVVFCLAEVDEAAKALG